MLRGYVICRHGLTLYPYRNIPDGDSVYMFSQYDSQCEEISHQELALQLV